MDDKKHKTIAARNAKRRGALEPDHGKGTAIKMGVDYCLSCFYQEPRNCSKFATYGCTCEELHMKKYTKPRQRSWSV